MKKIHLIPTDKPSRLLLSGFNTLFLTPPMEFKSSDTYQNIYITSDEELEEGGWHIYENEVKPTTKETVDYINSSGDEDFQKIIATADPDLIKDGVQAIDDEFLEWFVENPSCEEVEVVLREKEECDCYYTKFCKSERLGTETYCRNIEKHITSYKIIIPKEEPKQETLEEADKVLETEINYWYKETGSLTSENIVRRAYSLGITEGAKWQADRMYSQEEVSKMLFDLGDVLFNNCQNGIKEGEPKKYFDVIIEQFKKK